MTTIFLAHTPAMLANYYGDRALAELRGLGDVRLNETGRVLDDPLALARAAGDARIVVADRQTPAPAAFFDAMPDLVDICRVAVDIRNIDVDAASRHGVLVTRASPGFIDSVAELAIGMMVDLGRGVSDAVLAPVSPPRSGPAGSCAGPPSASSATARSAGASRNSRSSWEWRCWSATPTSRMSPLASASSAWTNCWVPPISSSASPSRTRRPRT
jgi:hypothetical protein